MVERTVRGGMDKTKADRMRELTTQVNSEQCEKDRKLAKKIYQISLNEIKEAANKGIGFVTIDFMESDESYPVNCVRFNSILWGEIKSIYESNGFSFSTTGIMSRDLPQYSFNVYW